MSANLKAALTNMTVNLTLRKNIPASVTAAMAFVSLCTLSPETTNPRDYPPVIAAMEDTIVKINDEVRLHASASDPNGRVDSLEWSFDTPDGWRATREGHICRTWYAREAGRHTVLVRAVDNDGVRSESDSIGVTVMLYGPVIGRKSDTTVLQRDTVRVSLDASDMNAGGRIVRYYLDKGGDGTWEDSSDAAPAQFRIANPSGGPLKVLWAAKDNDGVMTADTFVILFNRAPVSVAMTSPKNGDSAAWASYDANSGKGSVTLSFGATDPDQDALTYSLVLGKDSTKLAQIYQGQGTSFTASPLDTTSTYYWQLTVVDPMGQAATAAGTFRTRKIDPLSKEGLTAYYTFDGNADDKSGNGYDGTVHGAAMTQDRFGKINAAYSFNGTSDYIDCGAVNPVTGNHFTLSVWIYFTDIVSSFVIDGWYGSTVIMKGNQSGTSGSYGINIANYVQGEAITFENTAAWFHVNPNKETVSYKVGSSKGVFSPHRWYNLSGTLNNNTLKLFINGKFVATAAMTGELTASTLSFAIGRKGTLPHHFFKGSIDDIRIYNRALSDQEIQALYHEGGYTPPLDAPSLTVWGIDSSRIAAKWNVVSGATGFILESAEAEVGPFDACYSGTNTAFIHTGLTANMTVFYRVKSTNATQTSDWSAVKATTANHPTGYWKANCYANGGFESGSTGWNLYVKSDSGAAGTASNPTTGAKEGNRFCRVTVTRVAINTEQNHWHIQLQDASWTVVKGREYHLTFWAKADSVSRRIQVAIHGDGTDKYAYREGKNMTLSTDWRQLEYRYIADVDGTDAMNIFFYCGYETGIYDFDDFILEELTLP
jgi:hypothetical protein